MCASRKQRISCCFVVVVVVATVFAFLTVKYEWRDLIYEKHIDKQHSSCVILQFMLVINLTMLFPPISLIISLALYYYYSFICCCCFHLFLYFFLSSFLFFIYFVVGVVVIVLCCVLWALVSAFVFTILFWNFVLKWKCYMLYIS